MGKKPVVALAGLVWAGMALTGCGECCRNNCRDRKFKDAPTFPMRNTTGGSTTQIQEGTPTASSSAATGMKGGAAGLAATGKTTEMGGTATGFSSPSGVQQTGGTTLPGQGLTSPSGGTMAAPPSPAGAATSMQQNSLRPATEDHDLGGLPGRSTGFGSLPADKEPRAGFAVDKPTGLPPMPARPVRSPGLGGGSSPAPSGETPPADPNSHALPDIGSSGSSSPPNPPPPPMPGVGGSEPRGAGPSPLPTFPPPGN